MGWECGCDEVAAVRGSPLTEQGGSIFEGVGGQDVKK